MQSGVMTSASVTACNRHHGYRLQRQHLVTLEMKHHEKPLYNVEEEKGKKGSS